MQFEKKNVFFVAAVRLAESVVMIKKDCLVGLGVVNVHVDRLRCFSYK